MKEFKRSALLALMATCAIGLAACDDKKSDDQTASSEEVVASAASETTETSAPPLVMDSVSEETAPMDSASEQAAADEEPPIVVDAGSEEAEISNEEELFKTVDVTNKDGNSIGVIQMVEQPDGVEFRVRLSDIPAGKHGIHVHQVGECDTGIGFASAASHYNPGNKDHGALHATDSHAGDLGNIEVDDSKAFEGTILATQLTLKPQSGDGRYSLYDADGSALIIHESEDDLKTQPTGDAGGRYACAVLTDASGDNPIMETPVPQHSGE